MSNQLTGSGNSRMIVRFIGGGGFGAGPLGTLVFPATVNVADPAGLADGLQSQLSVDATGRLRVVLTGAAPVAIIGTQPSQLADTVYPNATRTVAPGAGAVLITTTPAAGTYDVELQANYDGAVAAAEINNLEVRRAAAALYTPIIIPSAANVVTSRRWRITLTGAQALDVRAIAAGTAAVGYNVALFLTRIA